MPTKELNRRLLRVAAVIAAIPSARTSKFVNLLTPKDKQQYVDECWEMLQEAYKGIGGFQSAVSPEHLVEDSHLWKLNVKGGKIVALVVYKAKFGRKGIGYATDGTSVGKAALKEIMHEDLTRAWVECSGPIEHMLLKMGGSKYIVPAEYASKLTGKECRPSEDGKHYTRQIAGHDHEKIIIGTPEGIVIKRAHLRRAASDLDGMVIRPEGWGASSDEALAVFNAMAKDKSRAWRGMTSAEYDATVGKGEGVKSRGDHSFSVEGTQFADSPADAESYVNYGRDDPRKSGKPTYLVEVSRDGLRKKSDGYWETAPGEGVPDEAILAVWKFEADGDAVVAKRIR